MARIHSVLLLAMILCLAKAVTAQGQVRKRDGTGDAIPDRVRAMNGTGPGRAAAAAAAAAPATAPAVVAPGWAAPRSGAGRGPAAAAAVTPGALHPLGVARGAAAAVVVAPAGAGPRRGGAPAVVGVATPVILAPVRAHAAGRGAGRAAAAPVVVAPAGVGGRRAGPPAAAPSGAATAATTATPGTVAAPAIARGAASQQSPHCGATAGYGLKTKPPCTGEHSECVACRDLGADLVPQRYSDDKCGRGFGPIVCMPCPAGTAPNADNSACA